MHIRCRPCAQLIGILSPSGFLVIRILSKATVRALQAERPRQRSWDGYPSRACDTRRSPVFVFRRRDLQVNFVSAPCVANNHGDVLYTIKLETTKMCTTH